MKIENSLMGNSATSTTFSNVFDFMAVTRIAESAKIFLSNSRVAVWSWLQVVQSP